MMKSELERKIIGQVIRNFREQNNISQDSFAYSINISRRYYGAIERGEKNISLSMLLRICDGLDVNAATIVAEIESLLKKQK